MTGIRQDLRQAARLLFKDKSFTVVATLTLALAVGVNTAVFSIVNAVLFKPLPIEAPESLVHIYSNAPQSFMSHEPMAHPDFVDLRQETDTLAELAGYAFSGFILETDASNEMIMGEVASGSYFELLGLEAAAGRLLSKDDDRERDANAVAVLSHSSWTTRFGSDPGIIGDEIRLNGHEVTVIGVGPEGFHGLTRGLSAELWVPIQLSRTLTAAAMTDSVDAPKGVHKLDVRRSRWLWVVGRLEEDASPQHAETELAVIALRLAEEYPDTNEERAFLSVPHEEVRILPGVDTALYAASGVIMAIVGLVLLIASSNLANMLLSRAVARQKEIATRLSLGASRAQLIRQLLVESLLLSLLGGAVGLVLAHLSTRLFGLVQPRLPIPIPIALDVALDLRVLAFALVASTLTAVLFGLMPAYHATRTNLTTALQDSGRAGSTSRRGRRLRGGLVVSQVAFSLLLLVCSGLSLRSMLNAHNIDPGFDPDGIVVAQLSPHLQGYSPAATRTLYDQLVEELRALPGVRTATAASHLPLTFEIRVESSVPEGDSRPQDEWDDVDASIVSPGYFDTMEIPLLRGRVFTDGDTESSPRVAVINQQLADKFWPNEDALGQRLLVAAKGESSEWQVVGIVPNGKYRSLGESTRPFLYRPFAQEYEASRSLLVDFDRSVDMSPSLVRDAIHRADPRLAVSGLDPLRQAMSPTLLLPRVGAGLFGLFGFLGLALAALGIYGVITYSISNRTQEIGIRMAFGANRAAVEGLVVRDGLRLTALGVLVGLVAAAAGTRVLSAILYGISATDFATFGSVTLVLLSVAFVASYLPARRASRLDPLTALHHD